MSLEIIIRENKEKEIKKSQSKTEDKIIQGEYISKDDSLACAQTIWRMSRNGKFPKIIID